MYLKIILYLWLFGSSVGLVFFSNQYMQFYSTKSWTETDAKVMESNVNYSKSWGGPKGPRNNSYKLAVVYDYRIGNNIFRSNNVYYPIKGFKIFASTTQLKKSQAWLNKYSKGSIVKAYYNPHLHAQSVLINEPPSGNIFIPIIFLLFLFLGIFNFYRYKQYQLKQA